ncbi:hypothetical protein AB0M50_00470 [Nonomuraea fuscirosea]|jgi:hypothetical protein|uniref:hypothetical protein n=1 Tax=Nonomuraea fuscirosea TaxID=1291556 RepID=UPI00342568B1
MNMPTRKRADVEEPFALILPDADVATYAASFDFLAVEPDSKITAFHGFSSFKGLKIRERSGAGYAATTSSSSTRLQPAILGELEPVGAEVQGGQLAMAGATSPPSGCPRVFAR